MTLYYGFRFPKGTIQHAIWIWPNEIARQKR
jgi:hypothetical protein